jgi:hypothetical protein
VSFCHLKSRPLFLSITSCSGPIHPSRLMDMWLNFRWINKIVLVKSAMFRNLELQGKMERPFHPLSSFELFLCGSWFPSVITGEKRFQELCRAVDLQRAHWETVFLRSWNFGQNHLGNFPFLLIYSAYGALFIMPKMLHICVAILNFSPNPCHINHPTWASQVSWEMGREGTKIHTDDRSELREIQQLAQGHTAN